MRKAIAELVVSPDRCKSLTNVRSLRSERLTFQNVTIPNMVRCIMLRANSYNNFRVSLLLFVFCTKNSIALEME